MIVDRILRKKTSRRVEANHLLSSLHFLAYQFPKSFWKKPTGIGMGRGIGTIMLYFLGKRVFFLEKTGSSEDLASTTTDTKGAPSIHNSGFTLIEMMISITLFSGILIGAFSAFGNITQLKNKVIADVDVYEQLYVAVESLNTLIKDGWDIDYEEYFNRSLVGTTLSGWHYVTSSWFGNFGAGWAISATPNFGDDVYYCRSIVGSSVTNAGCALTGALNTSGNSQAGSMQRYGQYQLQFTDFNSPGNNDTQLCTNKVPSIPGMPLGDEDCDGNITGDSDDESLGLWPVAFPQNTAMPELYLIKKNSSNPTRILIRLKIERDPDAPATAHCNTQAGTGTGCIGRLQILRLIGRDLGASHGSGSRSYNGRIDTWECQPDFPCVTMPNQTLDGVQRYLPTGNASEWVDIFSKDISVNSANFFLSPNIDYTLAWKGGSDMLANSMLRMQLRLGYSWKKRKLVQFRVPEIDVTTTINLRK